VRRTRPRGADPALHVVLLAGGSGTRFWPASRTSCPKQFLALDGRAPLLVRSWQRARRLVPASRLWVVAPRTLVARVRRVLPELRADRVVVEPTPRDTAPAVALATSRVAQVERDAVLAILPTDHVIADERAFARAVHTAVAAARSRDALVCLGVTPDRPATGFGYLECAARPRSGDVVAVRRFVEKPTRARAQRFLRAGTYLWNAGMFVWRAERFIRELERVAPAIAEAIAAHLAGRRGAWAGATKRSVDFAVMEHARNVAVVPLDAGWDDVGSWDAAARLRAAADGEHVLLDSPDSAVFADRRVVAVLGVPGVIVVDAADALLVVARERAQDVKAVVDELRRRRRDDVL
jgi:mannose-1-phosphate guanylyltransferase